jgi:hypothetical protein
MSLKSNIPTEDMINKTIGEFGYFSYFSRMITNISRCTPKIKYNIDIAKLHSKIRNAFQQQI